MSPKLVKLRSSDSEIAVKPGTIKITLEDGFADSEIPLPKVPHSKTMAMVIQWLKKQADKEVSVDELGIWKNNFMEIDTDTLYDLLMASHFLDVKDLHDSCFAKFVHSIKGKLPEEIREIFKINNDFSAEEEEQIRKDQTWAFKKD